MIKVLGVPATGFSALSPQNQELALAADVLISSPRLLSTLPANPHQVRTAWPRPLTPAIPKLFRDRDTKNIVVLATGDPLVSGIGSTLVRRYGIENVHITPAVSSVALARARMGWAAEHTSMVSLVARPVSRLRRYLQPAARIIVLSSGPETVALVAKFLIKESLPQVPIVVLGDLGTARESRHEATAQQWAKRLQGVGGEAGTGGISVLHVLAIEIPENAETLPAALTYGTAPGLADHSYDHDGQLTKWELRALALASLRPMPAQTLWDLGSGAGSVAIEWSLHSPRSEAIAIERKPARAETIRANALALHATRLQVLNENVHEFLEKKATNLPAPDAIFFGGGITKSALEKAWDYLAPGGRLVAHTVTMESEAVLQYAFRRFGGRLRRMSVERAAPLGTYTGWVPARPVVQWSVIRPGKPAIFSEGNRD